MLAVMGPTASGKTAFAVNTAREVTNCCREGLLPYSGCEIISADSRQVYRNMNIGTGKDLAEYAEVPYHLINIAEAGEKYDLFRYKKDFQKVYKDIKERNVFPILCGGSGLYIEAVCKDYALKEVAPNPSLRKELEEKSMEELVEMLTALKREHGSQPHNNTDFDTRKRVIRAIEIELSQGAGNGGRTMEDAEYEKIAPKKIKYLALAPDREIRNKRIDARLDARLREGMVEEVKALLERGIKAEDLIYYGLEYKFITQYLTGEISYDYMKEHLAIAIHQFAKRQMTWLRGMERRGIEIEWLPAVEREE
ncbi:MAG: tRNA (adenosine(37)-N6)-dimethylallyltransferase MiaA [Bacteroidales bacterium]|nr:tRNA (adenosine(37)-N6)-dimethylallyltransferase MiaA [Bacteroidales bacterium]